MNFTFKPTPQITQQCFDWCKEAAQTQAVELIKVNRNLQWAAGLSVLLCVIIYLHMRTKLKNAEATLK